MALEDLFLCRHCTKARHEHRAGDLSCSWFGGSPYFTPLSRQDLDSYLKPSASRVTIERRRP